MKFIFVIGVEGCGHHMLTAVLKDCIDQDTVVKQGDWTKLLTDYWDPEMRFEIEKENPDAFKDLRTKFRKIISDYQASGVTHMYEEASFPYNNPRTAIRRPDIIDFAKLSKGLFDIRYLIMYRNPIAATYSGVRRMFTDNIYLQAKIIESNLLYIKNQMSSFPPSAYKILNYDEFCKTPEDFIEGIANWFSFDFNLVKHGLNYLEPSTAMKTIPEKQKAFLEEFFTSDRVGLWEEFYKSNSIASKVS